MHSSLAGVADRPALTAIGCAPWRLSGTVVGVLLNDPRALDALGAAAHAPPYKAPPVHPVLYVKPRNSLAPDGATVLVPAGVPALEVGAAVAIVFGSPVSRVDPAAVPGCIAAVAVVADLCIPHATVYRPAVPLRARDGFLPVGPIVPWSPSLDLDDCTLRVTVDGREVWRGGTGGFLRPAARLVADVSAFMSFAPGDLLLLGVPAGVPQVGAGHAVTVTADGIGSVAFTLAAEDAA